MSQKTGMATVVRISFPESAEMFRDKVHKRVLYQTRFEHHAHKYELKTIQKNSMK
jgi:hypothetical protein